MSVFLISLLFTIGASGWIFNKLQDRSGHNTSQSATATSVSAVIIFMLVFALLKWGI